MSVETRVEEFILAPSDPAWGDERNRDEYYRAMTVAQYWTIPAFLLGSLLAAAQGARPTAYALIVLMCLTQLAGYRYCTRHDIPLASINKAFLTTSRKLAVIAILIPYLAVWAALMLDGDPSTIAGALVGGVLGALGAVGIAYLAARGERRRQARAAAEDDVFD